MRKQVEYKRSFRYSMLCDRNKSKNSQTHQILVMDRVLLRCRRQALFKVHLNCNTISQTIKSVKPKAEIQCQNQKVRQYYLRYIPFCWYHRAVHPFHVTKNKTHFTYRHLTFCYCEFKFDTLFTVYIQRYEEGKGGKNRRRGKGDGEESKRELEFKEDGT